MPVKGGMCHWLPETMLLRPSVQRAVSPEGREGSLSVPFENLTWSKRLPHLKRSMTAFLPTSPTRSVGVRGLRWD